MYTESDLKRFPVKIWSIYVTVELVHDQANYRTFCGDIAFGLYTRYPIVARAWPSGEQRYMVHTNAWSTLSTTREPARLWSSSVRGLSPW